jgi:hypothetical protein
VTRPRAADDFPMIRARMEELRRERSRPRAADDFPMIRARMEELRRERAQILRSRPCPYRQSRDEPPFSQASGSNDCCGRLKGGCGARDAVP